MAASNRDSHPDQLTFSGETNLFRKERMAIERIRAHDPLANGWMDKPYYTAYSGGKDSDVLRILMDLAGARHDLVHNHTTVDAPETVRYVRSIPRIQINMPTYKGQPTSMWRLIAARGMPPTRRQRYCCEVLKEQGGADRMVVTGVRWAESAGRRMKRASLEARGKLMLNADNDNHRRLFESCTTKLKWVLNPIIDWTDTDVWAFLRYYKCQSNPLYQCGYRRVGCVGCPMAGRKWMLAELEGYPKYRDNYIRAFSRMLASRETEGKPLTKWGTGQDVYDWWVSQEAEADEAQFEFEEVDYEL